MKRVILYTVTVLCLLSAGQISAQISPTNIDASIALKIPGNDAVNYSLKGFAGDQSVQLKADKDIPVVITRTIKENRLEVVITAKEDINFNFKQRINTSYSHDDCQFYMPGFWYRRNLRSPKEAPSFHTSDSWTVREDRLSVPMTAVFNEKTGEYLSVMRMDDFTHETLTTHKEGEVIVSGKTSIGYTGFENVDNSANLSFGFPYYETPKTYIRKLTLAPPVEAFQHLGKGESIQLTWLLQSGKVSDFSELIRQLWEYSYDTWRPKTVDTPFGDDFVKETLTGFFTQSFVDDHPLKFNSGEAMVVATCESVGRAEIGFVGRVLLNAFNALEYGQQHNRDELVTNSYAVFDSYLDHGFTPNGLFREFVNFDDSSVKSNAGTLSIRRQSEGLYAMFHFLQYEKENGRKHPEWESKMKTLLGKVMLLQNADGSFPRKFNDDLAIADGSGGSTPSVTVPLVMASQYFNDKKYLAAAKKTADYLEKEIISKADYFSSTLDANCEDKEASLYAATAMYYLALVSKGNEQQYYADLCRQASYFALSWYYMWDVPFAQGQMIGDIGLKTRGWGNVSVENNHIDVFIFEFGSVLNWLSKRYEEPRFNEYVKVISSSMRQLLPFENHMCGVAKTGYYPEVVQHTNWDYGRNGKGFYNNIFAPGWTVASLWELLSPGRAEKFLLK
ncbi:MAG: hypothetical protein VB074_04775 [Proteiniphilum sp.]|uniref:hypothetical protein n=1 Tax=Proteiniphilum sp. TaxID=1926877 RepID=UPI00092CA972|nr:hypothetical protein [Proteiniphilum sp.]MEA5127475.1 hypothetical protein [Proteiniphilum sp.]OJV86516.1 MAG: hypothetical protein BGO34_06070 [Bacteroidia bacterium 44-10]